MTTSTDVPRQGGAGGAGGLQLRGALLAVMAALAVATAPLVHTSTATAQQQNGSAAQSATPEVRQMQLTDKQVAGFLGAQKDLVAITSKLEAAGDTIDDKLQKELDDIGRRHGFKDFADFEEVRANVMMVLAGIDPDTGEYSDPIELIKKDIEAIKADKTLTEDDRKSQLDEMTEALKEMQPLKYNGNIDVVKKYAKQIDEVLK
jgi:hypothetical protein